MVSVEKYSCFCSDSGSQRITSKTGRGFLNICPEEKYLELMDVYKNKVLKEYKPNQFPLCHCGDVAILWASHSIMNPMHPYLRCPGVAEDEKCSFFEKCNFFEKCSFFQWTDQSAKTG